jgi:ClpP class serine protease
LRFDFSGAAKQYGVQFGHVSTSDYAMSNSTSMLFSPPTRAHHANAIKSVGLAYERFRDLVSTGRDLSPEQVLSLAEGRVFTGLQAQQNGLVDGIGGLHRAIAFAQRNYTTSGNAKVVDMNEDSSFQAQLVKLLSDEKGSFWAQTLIHFLGTLDYNSSSGSSENYASSNILGGFSISLPKVLPNKAYGIYLTIDENEAIRSLLESGSDSC